MVDNNDSLLREVDEELRRDQLRKLWERYGIVFVGAAVALVLAVAGYKWNEARQLAAAQEAGARYEAATQLLADNKAGDAIKAFEDIAKSGPTGYAVLAGLMEAGELAKTGKAADAVAAFDKVATSSPDPMFAELARLQAASLRLGTADFDEMQNRLKPLMADSAPFRFSARELLGLAAFKAGRITEAREALEKIVGDPQAPAGVAQRVQVLMSQVAYAELQKGGAAGASGAKPAEGAGKADGATGGKAAEAPTPPTTPAAAEKK